MQRNIGQLQKRKGYRSLQENQRYQWNISCKDEPIKDRNGMGLTEAEDIKNTQKNYTKKMLVIQIAMMTCHSQRARHPGV